jgi:signal transduction histidine kinase
MLSQFLNRNRKTILALAEEKISKLAGHLPSSKKLRKGISLFFELLINYTKANGENISEGQIVQHAAKFGKELMHLNYTLSHVVHAYGSMCQAVTELAQEKKFNISAQEFNDLNLCLDIAIASAVTEFQFQSNLATEAREVQHLGFLAHELRNSLSSATIANEMIRQGLVGTGGSTARVLSESLARMQDLIDRSLSEVRLRADPVVDVEKFSLFILVEQILLTAQAQANSKNQILKAEIFEEIFVETDRQLLLSVIANLVHNAIKFSKKNGIIYIRAGISGTSVRIEVEDECGGISPELMKTMFKPFVKNSFDHSGLGLGLTIVCRALALIQGKVSVSDIQNHGCSFLVEIPLKILPVKRHNVLDAASSVQPEARKNRNS